MDEARANLHKNKAALFNLIGLLFILGVYLAVTLYHLAQLPGEWYGDISIEHRQVVAIMAGGWPWKFTLSAGPAYHYVVAAFAYFLGTSFFTYKLASIFTGLVALIFLYLMAREIGGIRVGWLSALVGALSFWLILFARLGSSPQILSPVLSAGAVYFLLHFRRTQRWPDIVISMALAGLGLFTYPSTFVLPGVVIALVLWQVLFTRPRKVWGWALALSVLALVPFVLWFYRTALNSPDMAQGGYVGSKVLSQGEPLSQTALVFGNNMLTALGMFQFTGDHAFRTNATGKPMLDPLSGALMAAGLIWLFFDKRLRPSWAYLIAPVVILLAPSAAPGIPSIEIPSASRSFGAAPFISCLVGLGLDAVFVLACRWIPRAVQHFRVKPAPGAVAAPLAPSENARLGVWAGIILVAALLVVIGFLNLQKYFITYAWGLPEHNQPWGTQIAQYVDSLPASTEARLTGCCWGAWAQPGTEDIYYMLKHPQGRAVILNGPFVQNCSDLAPGKAYALILPPYNGAQIGMFNACFPNAQGELHRDGLGQPAFYSLLIP